MKKNKSDVLKHAFFNAFGTAIYIVLVVSLIMFIGKSSLAEEPDTILAPISMLTLFVFSAALTGFLVLGRPILWYLDGKKHKATLLLTYTLIILFVIIIILFSFLYLMII